MIKQARYQRDESPIDPACACTVCARYSRAYLHHLYNVKEMLASRLNTIHNLSYFSQISCAACDSRSGRAPSRRLPSRSTISS